MSAQAAKYETFIGRAVRLFPGQLMAGFRCLRDKWGAGHRRISDIGDIHLQIEARLVEGVCLAFVLVYFLALTLFKPEGFEKFEGVGGTLLTRGALAAVLGGLSGTFLLVSMHLIAKHTRAFCHLLFSLPFLLWAPLLLLWNVVRLSGQFALLVPLAPMVMVSRVFRAVRRIFFTCPARECGHRGWPAHACPHCGEKRKWLYPNAYGVLRHHCSNCKTPLPTLHLNGRHKLDRYCGRDSCRMPLIGKHAGFAPERLVALCGGPSSGKTCYLLMAAGQILEGEGAKIGLQAKIDVPAQEADFNRAWQEMRSGIEPQKTTVVNEALMLYAALQRKRFQLYLYDAPGEEFETIAGMGKQHYFPLVEGFIVMVDPKTFNGTGQGVPHHHVNTLSQVVTSLLGTAMLGVPPGRDGRFDKRVAIVISKADIPEAQDALGDIRMQLPPGERCRQALMDWGVDNAVRAVEGKFKSVEYFACSPLGRPANGRSREPFEGVGVLAPLYWALTGKRLDG